MPEAAGGQRECLAPEAAPREPRTRAEALPERRELEWPVARRLPVVADSAAPLGCSVAPAAALRRDRSCRPVSENWSAAVRVARLRLVWAAVAAHFAVPDARHAHGERRRRG